MKNIHSKRMKPIEATDSFVFSFYAFVCVTCVLIVVSTKVQNLDWGRIMIYSWYFLPITCEIKLILWPFQQTWSLSFFFFFHFSQLSTLPTQRPCYTHYVGPGGRVILRLIIVTIVWGLYPWFIQQLKLMKENTERAFVSDLGLVDNTDHKSEGVFNQKPSSL